MKIEYAVNLSAWCTMGIGGAARYFARATDESEVLHALEWARERDLPVQILGGGSNVVVSDEGFPGLVLQIAVRGIAFSERDGRAVMAVGAGEEWDSLVAAAVQASCAGFECLSGIPGLVGGTPIQNVGAYGQDVSGSIVQVRAIDRTTREFVSLANEACRFGYRTSRFKREDRNRFVVTRVDFALQRGGPPTVVYPDVVNYFAERQEPAPTVAAVREAILSIRRRKGMVIEDGNPASRSVGSFFVNPVIGRDQFERLRQREPSLPNYPAGPDAIKVPAAWLIERAGFVKGTRRRAVGVSPFQAQAIVNLGGARAVDVLRLACEIKRAVWKAFAVVLVPEPVFVGFAPTPDLTWLLDPQSRV